MKKILCLILVLISFFMGFAQETQKSGILYGPNWACMVEAPIGWIMDQDTLAKYHIYGLFYEEGTNFADNPPIVYISSAPINGETDEALQKYVESFISNYTKKFGKKPEVQKSEVKNLGKYFFYYFDYGSQHEYIIFVRYKNGVHSIVGATREKEKLPMIKAKVEEVASKMKFMDAEVNKKN